MNSWWIKIAAPENSFIGGSQDWQSCGGGSGTSMNMLHIVQCKKKTYQLLILKQ